MLNNLFNSNELLQFCKNVNTYLSQTPRAKMVGVSVYGGAITLKVYVELLTINETQQIPKFLSSSVAREAFKDYLPLWDSSLKSSLAVGIKCTDGGKSVEPLSTEYFHIKFGTNYAFTPMILKIFNIKPEGTGISGEFSLKGYIEKEYAYVRDWQSIVQLMDYKFRGNYEVDQIDELELYEDSLGQAKVNVINKFDEVTAAKDCNEFVANIVSIATQCTCRQICHFFKTKFNKTPYYFGMTTADVASLYFSFTDKLELRFNV